MPIPHWLHFLQEDKVKKCYRALFLFFLILTICSGINGYILASSGASSSIIKYMGRDIWISFMLLIPFMLPRPFSLFYGIVASSTVTLFSLINGIHFLLYQSPIEWHVVASIQETHFNECYEFIKQYIDLRIIIYIFLVPAIIIFLLRRALDTPQRDFKVCLYLSLLILISFSCNVFSKSFTEVIQRNAMINFFFSLEEYRNEAKTFASIRVSPDLPSEISCDAPQNQLIVIVIGESSNRHHYGIYGYSRETTPRLNQHASDLFVFTDVISPHCHTVSALSKVMTFANFDGDAPRASVIDILNEAGYQTVLLSNQALLGKT